MLLPKKTFVASLDIHAQRTFTTLCPDELPVPGGSDIVDALNENALFASKRVGVKEAHHTQAAWVANEDFPAMTPVEGDNMDIAWPAHSIVGTDGFKLIPGLPAITDYDYYVWQGIELDMHPYGVCYHDLQETLSTGVIEFLRVNQISTVITGGLATDYCVKTSVLQLCQAGFQVVVNLGACRGVAEDSTAEALVSMQQAGAICVESARDCRLSAE